MSVSLFFYIHLRLLSHICWVDSAGRISTTNYKGYDEWDNWEALTGRQDPTYDARNDRPRSDDTDYM